MEQSYGLKVPRQARSKRSLEASVSGSDSIRLSWVPLLDTRQRMLA